MTAWKNNNRGPGFFLALAVVLHAVFILVPVTKKMVKTIAEQRSVEIRLIASPVARPVERMAQPVPLVDKQQPGSPVLEELPPVTEPVAVAPPPAPEIVRRPPAVNSKRVLSSQFDYENAVHRPMFGTAEQNEDVPDFYYRERKSLDMVLNRPSLQLPFEDTRIYLVDSYEPGVMGGIDKFWDKVSVPFGFTTKNNTRVQCVWVLVIAGCGWGHNTLFHRPARYREKPKESMIENT